MSIIDGFIENQKSGTNMAVDFYRGENGKNSFLIPPTQGIFRQ